MDGGHTAGSSRDGSRVRRPRCARLPRTPRKTRARGGGVRRVGRGRGRDADAGLEGHAKLEGVRVGAEGVDVFGLAEEVPAAGGAHLRARGAARAVREVGIVHVVDEAEVIARLGEGHAEVPPLEERAGDADGSVVSRVGDRDGRVVRRGRRAKRKTRARISVRRMRSEGSASARDRRTRRERRPHRAARAIESTVEASPSGVSSARANCTTTCT